MLCYIVGASPLMCSSVYLVTLWVRPDLFCVSVRSFGDIVGASPPTFCVRPFVVEHCGCIPPIICVELLNNFRWKTTFDRRRPLMEGDHGWKTTLDGRRPSMEDDLIWKTTFDGRRPAMENELRWKTTFDGRRILLRGKYHTCGPTTTVS